MQSIKPVAVWAQTIEEKSPTCEIKVSIPHLSDPENPAASDRLSDELREAEEKEVVQFRQDYRRPLLENELPGSLDRGYDVIYQSPWAVSLSLSDWQFTGGAHGNGVVQSVLYDRKNGVKTELKDLFRPGTDYLGVISKASIAALLKANPDWDEHWVNEGAAPKADNFATFFPRAEGLDIQFQSYQVACYAAGQPDVTIPWEQLRPLMRPDTPVQNLAQVDPWEYLSSTIPGLAPADKTPLLQLGQALGSVEDAGHAVEAFRQQHPDQPLPQAAETMTQLRGEEAGANVDMLLKQVDDAIALKASDRYLSVVRQLHATGMQKPEALRSLTRTVLEHPDTVADQLALIATLPCDDKDTLAEVYPFVRDRQLPQETLAQTGQRFVLLANMLGARRRSKLEPTFDTVQHILRDTPEQEGDLMKLLSASIVSGHDVSEALKLYVAQRNDPDRDGVQEDGEKLSIGNVRLR